MSAAELLDLPEVRAQFSPITVEQYHAFPLYNERGKRTELIRGIILEKVAKSPLHATIATLLLRLVVPQIPAGYTLRLDQPLTFPDSEPEPDLAVVRGVETEFLEQHPAKAALVVEIAVTSLSLDREKARVYAEAGVEEYWIIIARERRAEVYRGLKDGKYTQTFVTSDEAELNCAALPWLRISLQDLPVSNLS